MLAKNVDASIIRRVHCMTAYVSLVKWTITFHSSELVMFHTFINIYLAVGFCVSLLTLYGIKVRPDLLDKHIVKINKENLTMYALGKTIKMFLFWPLMFTPRGK